MIAYEPEAVFLRIGPSFFGGDALFVNRAPEVGDPEEFWDDRVTEVYPMHNTLDRMVRASNLFIA